MIGFLLIDVFLIQFANFQEYDHLRCFYSEWYLNKF